MEDYTWPYLTFTVNDAVAVNINRKTGGCSNREHKLFLKCQIQLV